MKYHQIDRNLFIKNRKKFVAQMAPHSLAVFNSNDIYPVSADSTLPFAQHRDIFYLSGEIRKNRFWFFSRMLLKKNIEKFYSYAKQTNILPFGKAKN